MNEQSGGTHTGHRSRMKLRFENDPLLLGFSEHEILEMLLYYCIPRADTNALAHSLISRYGTLCDVLEQDIDELVSSGLLSRNSAVSLKFFDAVAGYLQRGGGGAVIKVSNFPDVEEYIFSLFRGIHTEQLRVFTVDKKNELVLTGILHGGGKESILLRSDKLAKEIAALGCRDVIIAHNHPFMTGAPSQADVEETRKLQQLLNNEGVILLDHYVVGRERIFSFRRAGLMNELL